MLRNVILFAYFLTVHLQKSPLVDILKLNENLFYNINEIVHTTMNRIFTALKLKAAFTESPTIQMLLIIHNDLNNIAEKICDTNMELMNSILVSNKTNRLDIFEALNDITKELYHTHTYKRMSADNKGNIDKHKKVSTASSVESLDFVGEFLKKFNELTVNDLIHEVQNVTELNIQNETLGYRRNRVDHLKVWQPPSAIEMIEKENKQTRRLYNGKRTRINQYPFVVSIHLGKQFLCAGSIIHKDLVITAASCLQLVYNNIILRKKPSSMHVRIASDYTKKHGDTVPITDVHFHPLYNSSTLKNNLALIRLSSRLGLFKTRKKIRRIMYDRDAKTLTGVRQITILGWGAIDHVLDPKHSQALAAAQMDAYDFNKCQDIYSKRYISAENFCVGFEDKGAGACDGDVGGPGVVNKLLVGVISFGSPVCGDTNMPTVFTKLGFYAKWISKFIKNKSSVKPKSQELRTKANQDHSEELMILNKLLNDLMLSNINLLDEFLYGDFEDDFEEVFHVSTTHDPLQHPLVNRSVFLFPYIHGFGNYGKTETIFLTTSAPVGPPAPHPGFNVEYMGNSEERIKVLEYAYPWLTATPEDQTVRTSTTRKVTTTTKHFTDILARTRKEDEFFGIFKEESNSVESPENTDILSDNYETASNEGLSIEGNK